MEDNNDGHLKDPTIRDRLTRIETEVRLGFREMDKALVLARNTAEKDKTLAKDENDKHFETLNQNKERMDRLELTFASKDDLSREIRSVNTALLSEVRVIGNAMLTMEGNFGKNIENLKDSFRTEMRNLSRLVYIGLGIAIAIQFFFKYVKV